MTTTNTSQTSTAPTASPASATLADLGGKYLTFGLGDEEYGISLMRVREIIALMDITCVPLTPDYVRGVMNLRGKVIPVVDLRRKFTMEATEDHDRKCIIVVDVEADDDSTSTEATQVGVLVDAVSEVLHIAGEDIEAPPSMSMGADVDFLAGLAKARDQVKILLDIDRVLASYDLQAWAEEGALEARSDEEQPPEEA